MSTQALLVSEMKRSEICLLPTLRVHFTSLVMVGNEPLNPGLRIGQGQPIFVFSPQLSGRWMALSGFGAIGVKQKVRTSGYFILVSQDL